MNNMSYILFICVTAPICSLLLVAEQKVRRSVLFLLIGMGCCLFVSELNGLLNNHLDVDIFYFTTSVTPITEELTKAIPIFIFAIAYSDKLDDLMMNAFFVGIGFAVLENLVLLTQNFSSVTLFWAVIRGFASGLMHGICTGLVGICISFVRKKKKLLYCGLFATFSLAIVYHSIFNSLVQSSLKAINYIGFALPISAYIPIVYFNSKRKRRSAQAK